jgi:hypothetical protein
MGEEIMTDKQMEFLAHMIADKFDACSTMEEVKEAVKQIKEMSGKGRKEDKQD